VEFTDIAAIKLGPTWRNTNVGDDKFLISKDFSNDHILVRHGLVWGEI
jgi:hypothetical protein